MTNSGIDHEHSVVIELAAEWLATTPHHMREDRSVVLQLRERFDLTPLEACMAVAQSRDLGRQP